MRESKQKQNSDNHFPATKGFDPLVWLLMVMGVVIVWAVISNSYGFELSNFW